MALTCEVTCPVNEEPVHLIAYEHRAAVLGNLGIDAAMIHTGNNLCSCCESNFGKLLQRYPANVQKVLSHVHVRRLLFSHQDLVGVGTLPLLCKEKRGCPDYAGKLDSARIVNADIDLSHGPCHTVSRYPTLNRGIVEYCDAHRLGVDFLDGFLPMQGYSERNLGRHHASYHCIDTIITVHTNEDNGINCLKGSGQASLPMHAVKIDFPHATLGPMQSRTYPDKRRREARRAERVAPLI